MRAHECPRDEAVAYRALLKGILDRAHARAHGHAARYWSRLREIADGDLSLLPLQAHDDFEAEIRARHGRKAAFWAYVNGTRRDRHDDEDDLDPVVLYRVATLTHGRAIGLAAVMQEWLVRPWDLTP